MRAAEVRRERDKLERISVATLEALVNALEAKDPYLRGHSARVADLSAMIAAEMGLTDETVELGPDRRAGCTTSARSASARRSSTSRGRSPPKSTSRSSSTW